MLHIKIRELRKKFHLTQKELAEILGVCFFTVCGWESGKATIPKKWVYRMCFIFKVNPSFFCVPCPDDIVQIIISDFGEKIVYHTGYLAKDRRMNKRLKLKVKFLDDMYKCGCVTYIQRRLGDFNYEYLAVRRQHEKLQFEQADSERLGCGNFSEAY